MEMELLPPFEIMQLLLPEKKIKMHRGFFFRSASRLPCKLLGFRNINYELRKFIMPGLDLLQTFGGCRRMRNLF